MVWRHQARNGVSLAFAVWQRFRWKHNNHKYLSPLNNVSHSYFIPLFPPLHLFQHHYLNKGWLLSAWDPWAYCVLHAPHALGEVIVSTIYLCQKYCVLRASHSRSPARFSFVDTSERKSIFSFVEFLSVLGSSLNLEIDALHTTDAVGCN